MMGRMLNSMRLQAERGASFNVSSRVGNVTSFDPNTWTAVVQLQPDDVSTGWLQVGSAWIGNGWGMFAPPNIGDQVTVEYINGDINSGTVVARTYNQANQPLPVPAGEFWLVHQSGAFFKFLNPGSLTFSDGQGATVTLNGDGTITSSASSWTHTGNVTFEGNVTVSETLTADTDVVGGGISVKSHNHNVPQAQGGSATLPTTAPV